MKRTQFPLFKNYKKVWIGFGIVLFLILVGLFGISFYVQSQLENRLSSINHFKYDNLQVSWRLGNIRINNFSFSPTLPEDSTRQTDKAIICKVLHIGGIHWWDLIRNKKLIVNTLSLDKLKINVDYPKNISNITLTDSSSSKANINEILIKKIKLNDADLAFAKSNTFQMNVQHVNGEVRGFEIFPERDSRKIEIKKIDVRTGAGHFTKVDGLYNLNWDNLVVNSTDKIGQIQNLQLQSKISKTQWKSKIQPKKSRLDITVPQVTATNFNGRLLFFSPGLIADELTVENAKMEIYSDESMIPCANCYKPFIHELLLELNIPVELKKIILKQCNIELELLAKNADQAGKISFENLYASIYNIHNTPDLLKKSKTITAEVRSNFMGKSALKVNFDFILSKPNYPYRFKGDLEQLDLVELNSLLRFSSTVIIKSGQLNKLKFDVTADNQLAQGDMEFNYENFKIQLIDKETNKPKKLLSSIVNTIGLKNNNTLESSNFKEGKMYYPRKRNHAIFHQWWYTIQSGLKSTLLPELLNSEQLDSK